MSVVSTRARNLLKRLMASEDRELVYSKGGGWWLDDTRIAGRDATELLRFCLIRECSYSSTTMNIYVPDESEAARLEADPCYVPEIIRLIAGKGSSPMPTLSTVPGSRQRATILAALRLWQRTALTSEVPLPEDDIATNGGTDVLMQPGEIDALCEELNCPAPLLLQVEGGVVHNVSGKFLGQEVIIHDYDVDGVPEDELETDDNGKQYRPSFP